MKNIFLLTFGLLFTVHVCAANPLLKHITTLNQLCTQSYGSPHPFISTISTLEMTAELAQACALSPKLSSHTAPLESFLAAAIPLINNVINAFINQLDRPTALRPLIDLMHEASRYIATHLPAQAARSTTTKKYRSQQKRFIGSLLGVALVGGVVKYIMLGALGLSALLLIRKIHRAITNTVREAGRETRNNRARIHTDIQTFCADAYQYRQYIDSRARVDKSLSRNRRSGLVRARRKAASFGRWIWNHLPLTTPKKEPVYDSSQQQKDRAYQGFIHTITTILEHPNQFRLTSEDRQELINIQAQANTWHDQHLPNARH